jgi:hypothetical protein
MVEHVPSPKVEDTLSERSLKEKRDRRRALWRARHSQKKREQAAAV